jgi:hypothetical protein
VEHIDLDCGPSRSFDLGHGCRPSGLAPGHDAEAGATARQLLGGGKSDAGGGAGDDHALPGDPSPVLHAVSDGDVRWGLSVDVSGAPIALTTLLEVECSGRSALGVRKWVVDSDVHSVLLASAGS